MNSETAIVVAPLPIASPAIGVGIIPVLGYIFPFSKNDKLSPPSTIGAAGLITNNGSSGFGLAAQLFMKENRYAMTSIYVRGNVNYNLYGIGVPAGNAGIKLPIDQSGQLFFGEALRRIAWQFFLGPRIWTGDSVVTVRPTSGETPASTRPRASHNLACPGPPAGPRYSSQPFLPHHRNDDAVHIGLLRQGAGQQIHLPVLQIHIQQIRKSEAKSNPCLQPVRLRNRWLAPVLCQLHLRHKQRAQRI